MKTYKYDKVNIDENTKPSDLWEPATGDINIDGVWIPNRETRRKMRRAKGKQRGLRQLASILDEAEDYSKNNPEFRQEIYKALYENLKLKAEKELGKEYNNDRTNEGN